MAYHIETRKYAFTIQRFSKLRKAPHIHQDVEMIYLTKGKSVATLDNKEYLFEAGELFFAFPNQIHYYHDKESVEGYLIIFTPELFKELKAIFENSVPNHPVLPANKWIPDFADMMEKIFQKRNGDSSYDEIVARGYFLALLGELIPNMELKDNDEDQDAIKSVLVYCVEKYREPFTLEMMSKDLYLNKYYISHIFRERMNMSYKDFINKLKVDYACGLLQKGGVSITEVAYESGFASVRTFNRVFLKHMHMTPREYTVK